jgi:hypothetical protein
MLIMKRIILIGATLLLLLGVIGCNGVAELMHGSEAEWKNKQGNIQPLPPKGGRLMLRLKAAEVKG